MIKLLNKLPNSLTVALSGGVDSVAIVDFLSRSHKVSCAFYHHGSDTCDAAHEFVTKFCNDRQLSLLVGYNTSTKHSKQSLEEFWRNQRYEFLENISEPVVTGHTLDDAVETYVYGALHGQPKVIPFQRNNIIRPFLLTRKSQFIDWCTRKSVEWYEDSSNTSMSHMRNYIRHQLMPHALHVNPGLATVVKKIIQRQYNERDDTPVLVAQ